MQIGPYILRERLGEGGMATVWNGTHTVLGTAVAFKFLRAGAESHNPDRVARFLDESRALARMRHPGIVSIFDAGLTTPELARHVPDTTRGAPYFVMEAVGGGTLDGHAFYSWSNCRRVLLGLLDALAHAHARDVVHRDLKPSNILIDEYDRLRLTDFGIARLHDEAARRERVSGTPHYMAPEQIAGEVDREGPWTDLYALGCLAYWMTTGSPPFTGELERVLAAHMDAPLPPLNPRIDVPDHFAEWCERLLAKDPQARFTRASDAALALRALGDAADTDSIGADTEPIEIAHTTILSEDEMPAAGPVPAGAHTASLQLPPPPKTWETPTTVSRDLAMLGSSRMVTLREPMFRGRVAERDELWKLLRQAWTTRESRVIAVHGEPGSGQRALIRWFARRAHETGSAHLLEFDDDVEASLRRHLRSWFRTVGGVAGATAFYATRGALDEVAEWDITEIAQLAEGSSIAAKALQAVHARWTARLAEDRVVLCVGEGGVVGEAVRMGQRIAPARRLAIYPTTADTKDPSIRLGPLGDDDIAATVRDVAGLSERAALRLARSADGNPGAALGWARLAARRGLLEKSPLGYDLDPQRLRELIASQNEHWVATCTALDPSVLKLAAVAAHVSSSFTMVEIVRLSPAGSVELALAELAHAGIASVDDDAVRFTHPGARRALRQLHAPTKDDHRRLWNVFESLSPTPRRRVIATRAGFLSDELSLTEVIESSRRLRDEGHLAHASELLRDVREHLADDEDGTALGIELVECELARQDYAAAREIAESLDSDNPNASALQTYLRLRDLQDVDVAALREIDPQRLSPTAARVLSYALTDCGDLERAREVLDNLSAPPDDAGRLYALARLEFVARNWSLAIDDARRAIDAFQSLDRPDGVVAARDLLASALLEVGDPGAVDLYRDNLRDADRLGFPALANRYNLGVAMLKLGVLTEETDLLLERAIADALQRGRIDIVHCGRAAQVLYAVLVRDDSLAVDRLEPLESQELGPWVQDDSLVCLEKATLAASAELRPRILAVLNEVRAALTP